MNSNAFLNDLMSKMKLPEAKGKKKTKQSESVAQILTAMQKVRAEKKKPPVTSYAPVKEMPVNEPESMEEFSSSHPSAFIPIMAFPQQAEKEGQVLTVCSDTASRGKLIG